MANGSHIQWTDATWNPIAGCTPVSPGCLNCYAAKMAHRLDGMGQDKYRGLTILNNGRRTFNGIITFNETSLTAPLGWKKPRMVFVNSMSDLFHKDVPFDYVDKVFAVMALCPQHTFQVLTKRPERMAEYLDPASTEVAWRVNMAACRLSDSDIIPEAMPFTHHAPLQKWPLPNVWLGTSVENQRCADERCQHLLRCPAAIRFLSVEPMLGPIVFDGAMLHSVRPWSDTDAGIHWMIVGGESGPNSRPFEVWWARSIIRQCKSHKIACFVKQLGGHVRMSFIDWQEGCLAQSDIHNFFLDAPGADDGRWRARDAKGGDMAEWPEDLRVREFPNGVEGMGQRVHAGEVAGGRDGAEG